MTEENIKLVIPNLRPVNGRLILQLQSRERFEKQKDSEIILPKALAKERAEDNRTTENPDDYDYFVVAISPEVNEQLMIYKTNYVPDFVSEPERSELAAKLDKVKIGDKITLSERFETIKYSEGRVIYGLIHWQDILGINSDKETQNEEYQKPEKLDLETFQKLPLREPFMSGQVVDGKNGIEFQNNGNTLYWVAKKGSVQDWGIYYSVNTDIQHIMAHGVKLKDKEEIKRLIDCTDEVMALYRK